MFRCTNLHLLCVLRNYGAGWLTLSKLYEQPKNANGINLNHYSNNTLSNNWVKSMIDRKPRDITIRSQKCLT